MNYHIYDFVLHHLCIYYFIIRRINIRLLFSSHNHSPYFFQKINTTQNYDLSISS
ncbi:hypothetical protein PA13_1026940 [Pseudomonas aeruginosa HB13]|nr:hypothetical protein PA13_1026940 [Pseudomonas aeruginosa HB13]KAF0591405.1 hypothetical protein PAPB9_05740 [Pseudomonas aeruginosa]